MEWLTEINAYHWIALGLILFAAEALGATYKGRPAGGMGTRRVAWSTT